MKDEEDKNTGGSRVGRGRVARGSRVARGGVAARVAGGSRAGRVAKWVAGGTRTIQQQVNNKNPHRGIQLQPCTQRICKTVRLPTLMGGVSGGCWHSLLLCDIFCASCAPQRRVKTWVLARGPTPTRDSCHGYVPWLCAGIAAVAPTRRSVRRSFEHCREGPRAGRDPSATHPWPTPRPTNDPTCDPLATNPRLARDPPTPRDPPRPTLAPPHS